MATGRTSVEQRLGPYSWAVRCVIDWTNEQSTGKKGDLIVIEAAGMWIWVDYRRDIGWKKIFSLRFSGA
jgi:hypothetical protein